MFGQKWLYIQATPATWEAYVGRLKSRPALGKTTTTKTNVRPYLENN
jgi:hypothetical protein